VCVTLDTWALMVMRFPAVPDRTVVIVSVKTPNTGRKSESWREGDITEGTMLLLLYC